MPFETSQNSAVMPFETSQKSAVMPFETSQKSAVMPFEASQKSAVMPFETSQKSAVMPRTVASLYTPSKVYKDNPPCNTLYIGNLSPFVNETEILSVFGTQPGYVQMKLTRQGVTNTCCFVQYSDIASASAVHAALQGTSLASSDRGPIRIQFSKNPLGVKGPGFGGGMGGVGGMGGMGGVGEVGGVGGVVKSEIGPVAEPAPAGTDGGAGGAGGPIGAEAAAAAVLAAGSGLT
ncbi:unnamed protein product [Closterium sp. NIES-54]